MSLEIKGKKLFFIILDDCVILDYDLIYVEFELIFK